MKVSPYICSCDTEATNRSLVGAPKLFINIAISSSSWEIDFLIGLGNPVEPEVNNVNDGCLNFGLIVLIFPSNWSWLISMIGIVVGKLIFAISISVNIAW